MACKSLSGDINGKPIYTMQWPATKALEMQMRLINALGDLALPFIEGTWGWKNLLQLLRYASVDTAMPILLEFVYAVRVDGKEISKSNFDMEYSGDLMRIFKTFAFSCEVQYKDFFEEGRALSQPTSKETKETT